MGIYMAALYEYSRVSWLVYTKWPVEYGASETSVRMWDGASVLKRHQSWCNIIFYFDFAGPTLEKEFYNSFYHHIYRTETIFILIRDTFSDDLLHVTLYSAPCLVLIEFHRTKQFSYLERNKEGVLFRSMPTTFSVVEILEKFPRLDEAYIKFLPGIVPTLFTDEDLGKCVCILYL